MNDKIQSDWDNSETAFIFEVLPLVKQILPTYTIQPSTDELDFQHGIDYVLLSTNRPSLPLAVRVQITNNYKSWTIRKSRPSGHDTELDKTLLPRIQLQAYVESWHKPTVLGIGMCWFHDLLETAETAPEFDNTDGSSSFVAIGWPNCTNKRLPKIQANCAIFDNNKWTIYER